MIRTRRIYDKAGKDDGYRILVDRLWPRGLSKKTADVDIWLKDIAPSSSLRKWFSHDPQKWDAFRKKYIAELDGKKELINQILELERQKEVLTLLYAAKDENFNQAVVLREYLLSD